MLRTIFLILWLAGLLYPLSTFAAPPELSIDSPLPGQILSGAVSFFGWALGETHPIVEVWVFFDDQPESLAAGYGGSRVDVAATFPDIPNADRSGFALAFNTRLLTNGNHTLRVVAITTNGESASREVAFLVSNAAGSENPIEATLDLTQAGVQVLSPTEIFVGNMDLNDQRLDSILQFDPVTNHFVMTSYQQAPVLVGAGDIAACDTPGAEATAQLAGSDRRNSLHSWR